MLKELLKPEILDLIDKRRWTDLRDAMKNWPAPEITDLLIELDKTDRALLYRALPREQAAEVFTNLDYDDRDELLYELTDRETKSLLAEMSPDDRTSLLEELPAKAVKRLMNLLTPDDLKEAKELLGYPDESIGRLMTPDFVAVREDWTIERALEHIRVFGRDSETIYRLYVTDRDGKLIDDILLRFFILGKPDQKVSELMDYTVVSVSAFDDQEVAVRTMERYDISALPVVDSDGKLVGIVTFDDVIDVQEEEATEDFQKIGAVNPVDQSYAGAGIFRLWMKRFPWLAALLFANFITAAVISHYDFALKAEVLLAAFIPLLIGTAGNSGTQSATLIVRSLAIEEITFKDWWRVMLKELSVGAMLGAVLGVFTYLRGLIEGVESLTLATIISLSMVCLVIWANIIGAALPLLIAKAKLDPAVISSPLIATLVDITGIIIYFNIAIWLLL